MGTSDHRPSGHCLCLYPRTSSSVILLDHIKYQDTIIFLEISFHMCTVLIFFFKTIIDGFHFRDRKEAGSKCLLSKEGVRFERVVSRCLWLMRQRAGILLRYLG